MSSSPSQARMLLWVTLEGPVQMQILIQEVYDGAWVIAVQKISQAQKTWLVLAPHFM